MCSDFQKAYQQIIATENGKSQEIIPKGAEVVLFGYGSVGKDFERHARDFGVTIVAFLDNVHSGFSQTSQLPIVGPAQVVDYPQALIYLATLIPRYQEEMEQQLLTLGISAERIIGAMAMMGCSQDVFETAHLDGYKRTYDLLTDDLSRDVLRQRIRSYFGRHQFVHSPHEDQYFSPDVITFTTNEVMVNAGCYDGQTDLAFIQRMKGSYRHIYAFEPDTSNYENSRRSLQSVANLTLCQKGLSDKDTTLRFDARGSGSSRIDETASTSIEVVSLDRFLSNELHIPTFIKMDIEGAELAALKGAEQTIRKHKPKLAICVYHKIEDIYEIPDLIASYGDYVFYLRHYTPWQTETVLYAIPRDA